MLEDDNNKDTDKNNDEEKLSPAYAVALGYTPEKDNAPKVLAKGQGHVAEKIIQIAIDEGIEIRQDADLIEILKAVDIFKPNSLHNSLKAFLSSCSSLL